MRAAIWSAGVRYITSLRIVERQIWMIVGFSLLACLLFLMLVVASNSYFIRSIVDPVLKINTIAKEIAAGRYGVRLQKTYDDEIGELCDTINYMSDEISRRRTHEKRFHFFSFTRTAYTADRYRRLE